MVKHLKTIKLILGIKSFKNLCLGEDLPGTGDLADRMAKMEDDIHPRLLDGEVKDKMGSPLMERIKPKFVTPTPPRYNFTAEMSPDLFATNSSISTIPDLNSTMASVMQGDQVTRGEAVTNRRVQNH